VTTKYLSNIYNDGYVLSSKYTAVVITDTGVLRGTSPGGTGGFNGGVALTVNFAATVTNGGGVVGGQGTEGDPSSGYYQSHGGSAGAGGAGASLEAGVRLVNNYFIFGGAGGTGGRDANPGAYTGYGGAGGGGGIGVFSGGGVITNGVEISGGAGGTGGAGQPTYYEKDIYGVVFNTVYHYGGAGGDGGAAIVFGGRGTLINTGTVRGGDGGSVGYGESFYPAGISGDGVDLAAGGRITNGSAAAPGATIQGYIGISAGPGGATTVTNFGTIAGKLTAVKFASAADRLIAEASSQCTGLVVGGGGTLEIGGGVDTLAGLGGTITITGNVSLVGTGFGAYTADAPAHLTLTGANTLAAGGKFIDQGHLNLATGATLAAGDGATIEIAGPVVNAGAVTLAGPTSVTALKVLAPGATLSHHGSITLSGGKARIIGATPTTVLTNLNNTISGVGFIGVNALTLVNETAGVIDAVGAGSLQVSTKGQTLVNGGLMEASAGGLLIIASTTVNNLGGAILAATGAKVELENDSIHGGAIGSAGTGIVLINVAGGEFNGAASAISLTGKVEVLNGKNLILEGAIANAGKLQLLASSSTADLIIGAAGATLSGKGTVSLSASAGNRIYGQALGDTLTNVDNLIEGSGQLGAGVMALINQAGGKILGNQSVALIINTVSNTITNAGLIENSGSGGTLVESAVVNTGTLMAAVTGTLTVTGAVTGAGVGVISGGTLDIVQVFSENVTFTGTTGVFELGHSVSYKGKVTGLSTSGTNSLDLADITFTSGVTKATYSGTTTAGTLTVTDGTHTAKIGLLGNYVGHVFNVASDGHGGTTVIDPPVAVMLPLVQAMAGLRAAPSSAPAAPLGGPGPPVTLLHAPA
jgi:hypothetical protein